VTSESPGGWPQAILPAPAEPGVPYARAFYERPAEEVAGDLLGSFLLTHRSGAVSVAQIVETEAYVGPHDDASHAAERIGRTARNASMFGPPGTAYVYRIYGIHWCLNVVTGREGYPAAVLLRAACPVSGVEAMRERRGGRKDRDLLRGPGNLCSALGVVGSLDGHLLDRPPLEIRAGGLVDPARIRSGPRVGVTRAADLPLRFSVRDCVYVSGRSPSPPTTPVSDG